MKVFLSAICMVLLITSYSSAAARQPTPQVVNIDQKLSVNVENITLGRLLRLWDQATGTHSTVPRELANQLVSVRFSGLPLRDAVQKIFQDLPFDYVFVDGQGIRVTGPSQKAAAVNAAQAEPQDNDVAVDVNAVQRMKPEAGTRSPAEVFANTPPPTPAIPTPFGPTAPPNGHITQLPGVQGQAPPPPFFMAMPIPPPPAGAANGPPENNLWAPISILPNTVGLPSPPVTPPPVVP
jgi:hypothetical protein